MITEKISTPIELSSPERFSWTVFLSVLAIVTILGAGLSAQGIPGSDHRLPYTHGRWVPPAEAEARGVPTGFFKRNGRDWIVYWDEALKTPRYLVPRTIVTLVPRSASQGGTVDTDFITPAKAFVERNRDFFGVGAEDLIEARVTPIARQRLVGFAQSHLGLTVRGAGLRILVEADGSIASIDAFLARKEDLPVFPSPEWQDENLVLQSARDRGGVAQLGDLDRQLLFPTAQVGEAVAGYRLECQYSDLRASDVFYRASGEYLGEVDTVLHFDGATTVDGWSPDPKNIFATGDDADGFYPIPDARVYVVGTFGFITGADGSTQFASATPEVNLWPSLEMGVFDPNPEPCLNGTIFEGEDQGINRDGIKTIFQLFATQEPYQLQKYNQANSLYDPNAKYPVDVNNPVPFHFDESQMPQSTPAQQYSLRAFQLLVYHSVRRQDGNARKQMAGAHILEAALDHFPLMVFIPVRADTYWEPAYQDDSKCNPRMYVSQQLGQVTWIPATIIQHEYAHHTIRILAGTNQEGDKKAKDLVDGVSDALVAFCNQDPRIGFLPDDFPGRLGRRVDDPSGKFSGDLREKVGSIFWEVQTRAKNADRRVALLRLPYVWLAQRQVGDTHQLTFDEAVIVDQLLIADAGVDNGDMVHAFPVDGQAILDTFPDKPIFLNSFIRGDVDRSGAVDLSDPINILNFLFLGGKENRCLDAMDVDDNGDIDLTDPIGLLAFLFNGGSPPKAPFPRCGIDPTDMGLWCADSPPACQKN